MRKEIGTTSVGLFVVGGGSGDGGLTAPPGRRCSNPGGGSKVFAGGLIGGSTLGGLGDGARGLIGDAGTLGGLGDGARGLIGDTLGRLGNGALPLGEFFTLTAAPLVKSADTIKMASRATIVLIDFISIYSKKNKHKLMYNS